MKVEARYKTMTQVLESASISKEDICVASDGHLTHADVARLVKDPYGSLRSSHRNRSAPSILTVTLWLRTAPH